MTVRMPHSFAGAAISDADIHGLVLERDRIPLLRAMLGALPEALANGRGSWAEVAALLRDHIAVALSDVAAAARQPAGLRVQARRFIETNLSEAIDARRVCAALGVSRSSIYRAFERDGGVTAFIQRRRLAHIHTLLSDPNEHRPIRDIAAKYGFVDRSHFSRLFRQTFGYTPGDLRMRKRAHAATVTLNDTARLGRRLVHWQ
jgi:AraC-like DNA-binding protein